MAYATENSAAVSRKAWPTTTGSEVCRTVWYVATSAGTKRRMQAALGIPGLAQQPIPFPWPARCPECSTHRRPSAGRWARRSPGPPHRGSHESDHQAGDDSFCEGPDSAVFMVHTPVGAERIKPPSLLRHPDNRCRLLARIQARPYRSSLSTTCNRTARAMTAASPAHPSVLFLELNEAERYWIDKFVGAGKLPVFGRLFADGKCLTTSIPDFDPQADRAWRTITPWIIWPSVYTGMKPSEHGIIAFGQDTTPIQGRCVWDVLDKAGVSTGVFGSLLSFPPRNAGSARYYVPESLADDPDCFPEEARPVQEFSVFTSRNYSESFARQYYEATRLLLEVHAQRRAHRHGGPDAASDPARDPARRRARARARDDPVVHLDRRVQESVFPPQARDSRRCT